MPSLAALLSYTVASFLIVIVPGPTVTVIIGNALRHGTYAGLLNVVGTQFGLLSMLALLTLGFSAISNWAALLEVLRLIGAAYLVWLGIRMWQSRGRLAEREVPRSRSFILQGFIVIWSNPKALLLFGAFIPQFVEPSGNTTLQIGVLAFIFMVLATLGDSSYALLAGNARHWLTASRIMLVERLAGSFLIAGGLWLVIAQ